MADWAILGCGYVGTRLGRALLADGERVRAGARRVDRLASLGEAGAELQAFDASRARAFGPLLYGLSSPIVVYSVPPLPNLPAGEAIRRAADACAAVGAGRFIYLGSTAVYGETPDGEVVDEDTPVAVGDPEAMARIGEESAVEMARLAGLSTVVLRLAAIYGPGRGVRERLKAGSYKLIDDGVHYFSRVHVDDVVGIIRAAASRAPAGAVYCVADDRPTTQREYADWLVARLGVAPPPSVPSLAPGAPRRGVRNRKLSNARLARELDYRFRYPSYVEGELAIERETGAAPAVPAAPSPPAPAPVVDEAALATMVTRVEALWLEVIAGELRAAAAHLDAARHDDACATLSRVAGLFRLMAHQRALVPAAPAAALATLEAPAAAVTAAVARLGRDGAVGEALRAVAEAAAQVDPTRRAWFERRANG